MTTSRPPLDLHQIVTDRIVAAIEAGVATFALPWQQGGAYGFLPRNAETGHVYSGINTLHLWAEAEAKNYPQALWSTYRGWQKLGAQVRGGEKASLVVFYKTYQANPDPDHDDDDGMRRIAKASWAFNVAQVEGYTPEPGPPQLPPIERIARIDAFLKAAGANVVTGGDRAYYCRVADHIQLPDEHRFTGSAPERTISYYATSLHEHAHWTGAATRLDRDLGGRFGDQAYSAEELVAELASAFLCAELGITPEPRPDHSQYIAHWLAILKADKRAIFTAAAKASEAARYLAAFSATAADAPQVGGRSPPIEP